MTRRERLDVAIVRGVDDRPEPHARKVARIVAQLRAHPPGTPVSLHKASVSHQVPKAHDLRRRDAKIDVSDLTEILAIDPVARTCTAESGVTFVDLVARTLEHGLVPVVVPELKTITVGGAVAGCSIESMSFVHGGFHDSCLEYEVITGRGGVLVVRPGDRVFEMQHGAFGTLGILAKLTFRLVPAKAFVRVDYETYKSAADYRMAISEHAQLGDADFLDGIIHAPDKLVLCVGRFVDEAPFVSSYAWMKVYYKSTAARARDYLRTADYLFRYDRGVTNVQPRSFLGRLLFGKLMTSTRWLQLAAKVPWALRSEHPTITLDVFVPLSKLEEWLAWCERVLGHYPLWCVPYRRVRDYPWLHDEYWAQLPDWMFVDIAIYGMKQRGGVDYHKLIEAKLRELGGIKTLISHNYYTEDEFWGIWNKPHYDEVKAITDPDNLFRDLYTKTCRAAMGVR